MPLCLHLTITLITQYALIYNYYVNCNFRFREVLLGNHKLYLDVAKIYQRDIFRTPVARYSLFELKVQLNTRPLTNVMYEGRFSFLMVVCGQLLLCHGLPTN